MSALQVTYPSKFIPAMSDMSISAVREFENELFKLPQLSFCTDHVIHAGIYSRTMKIPAGVCITGVLIKIPTTLIVCGDCRIWIGDKANDLAGYNVLAASANRKQVFLAFTDTWVTMSFATKARTVEEAESEFTDERRLLASHKNTNSNTVTITEER